jgi:hypothetical protein
LKTVRAAGFVDVPKRVEGERLIRRAAAIGAGDARQIVVGVAAILRVRGVERVGMPSEARLPFAFQVRLPTTFWGVAPMVYLYCVMRPVAASNVNVSLSPEPSVTCRLGGFA